MCSLLQKSLQKYLVIGNESCDLDSTVSALGIAFHLTNHRDSVDYYVPVLNITRQKLPVKSEVTHFLKKNEIDLANIICWYAFSASCFKFIYI